MESAKTRIIQVEEGVVGPSRPRTKTVKLRKIGDYSGLPKVYSDVIKSYGSTLFVGPPVCDEFVALIQYMFTEEEASMVRHLRPFPRGKSAQAVAKAEHRPLEAVRQVLEGLAHGKRVIVSHGPDDKKVYSILPIIPGTFELALMRTSMDTLTDWHRGFAELFAALWETGFMMDYLKHPSPLVRYLPVQQGRDALPFAWPSDRLEEILDRYDAFAVGLCQCRMTEKIVGRGCDKPLENCTAFGPITEFLIQEGMMRRAEKKEILEIKAEAESHGLVSWMFNEESGKGSSGSCSCCGCCCHMLRSITEFNMPALIAPPHFMPFVDLGKCDYCGKCARACPMGAITVDMKGKTHAHAPGRCIGCGLCTLACEKRHAVEMREVPGYRRPPKSWPSLIAGVTPNLLRNAWSAKRAR